MGRFGDGARRRIETEEGASRSRPLPQTEKTEQPEPESGAPGRRAPTPRPASAGKAREAKTRRVQLLVRPSDHERWRRAAAEEGVSVNELVCRAVERFCEGR